MFLNLVLVNINISTTKTSYLFTTKYINLI